MILGIGVMLMLGVLVGPMESNGYPIAAILGVVTLVLGLSPLVLSIRRGKAPS